MILLEFMSHFTLEFFHVPDGIITSYFGSLEFYRIFNWVETDASWDSNGIYLSPVLFVPVFEVMLTAPRQMVGALLQSGQDKVSGKELQG